MCATNHGVEWFEVVTNCDHLQESIKYSPVAPFAFTEQGIAMLSSVLKSAKAIQVNIAIMRAFVFIKQYALSHKDLTEKLKELESKYNRQFKDVYEAINYLMEKDKANNRNKIGFKRQNE